MSKSITSTISGHGLSQADLAEFCAAAKALCAGGDDLKAAASAWGSLRSEMMTQSGRLLSAPCRMLAPTPPGHADFDFVLLSQRGDDHSVAFHRLSDQLSSIADGLITAYSLYSSAEDRTSSLISKLLDLAFQAEPLVCGSSAAAMAIAGSAYSSLRAGTGLHINWADVSHRTRGSQERFLNGLAGWLKHSSPLGVILDDKDQGPRGSVNAISGKFSILTSALTRLVQGDKLTVTQVEPQGRFLSRSSSISEALSNLQTLGDGGKGIGYGTVAVQKYRHTDGSIGWVVTIPGTDGKPDSPMGWEQNLELMSSRGDQRERAASARLVSQALERAGVGSKDQVALVGHSQGGIVAAAVASDLGGRYNISHVVTAGSPIANHPVPSKTWVTSVEMDDELVSSLDGSRNPQRDSWLTVRGSSGASGTPVPHSGTQAELTHGMSYQRAAWQNAASQGTPALNRHDRHFRQITQGSLEGTMYYQGRMGH
ncbi:putative alpha/beta hydrolase [Bifidobacterium actinocoloniiforme DSM 22766]|uniref:Putative alpha/beta hydrolase n=1 Tax=Bifidobacterium actinocoloniiforme DSM 22766 TaxID=1437605 RepID=A0A086Z178_9BIFI|nr:hypothetical protein [Bifidobacterium actinocoloniiforme]AKV55442.1 hypothetical protein AB656_03510 [Bifidobacterium actinocoloniiforme DSM 22766]KFI40278.1 putative alpha/beta hydrolase [Bifidobacterium actinocoloniiforme DSM 22766]